ncbi:hypothetical protein CBM2598_U20110 [Cupriavidus taiwanensis]|nr:hypothetical protein CBM2598_U20110 [Cupriavidus taiwanensis]
MEVLRSDAPHPVRIFWFSGLVDPEREGGLREGGLLNSASRSA